MMKKTWIRNLMANILVLIALLVFNGQVFGATPKDVSIIDEDTILLRHVFDGIVANGDHALAPAPQPGKELVLGAQSLNRIARAFDLNWRAGSEMDRTVIRRAATVVPFSRLESALRQALSDKLSTQFEIDFHSRQADIVLPSSVPGTVAVETLSYDALTGGFSATLALAPNDPNVHRVVLSGDVHRIHRVPVLNRRLRSGDLISARDIDWIDMRSKDINKAILLDEDKIIGMTPKRVLSEGQPIRKNDVQMPLMVSRGDVVTMILKTPLMSLTAQGKALSDAAEGEMVRIKNTSSNQIIEAMVTGPQQVSVQLLQGQTIN